MHPTILLILCLMALTAFFRLLESSRRHVLCVRFEHDLRRTIDGLAARNAKGAER